MALFNDYANLNGIEKILNYIASYIIQNETICKCLKYDSPDCLSKTLTELDIESLINTNSDNIANRRIYFQPFINKTIVTKRTELRIYPINFGVETRVLAKYYISIEILTHNDLWDLDDSRIRPLAILNELAISLNGAEVEGIGLLSLEGERIPLVAYNDYISGYRLTFCTGVD